MMHFGDKGPSGQLLSAGMHLYSQLVCSNPVIPSFALDRRKWLKSLHSDSRSKSPNILSEENSVSLLAQAIMNQREHSYVPWSSVLSAIKLPLLYSTSQLAENILKDCFLFSLVASLPQLTHHQSTEPCLPVCQPYEQICFFFLPACFFIHASMSLPVCTI